MSSLLNLFNKNRNLVDQFKQSLGENLFSLIQYGSSVKGNKSNKSDVNLLIVLQLSTPEAHEAIHQIIHSNPKIEPLILGKRGLDKTIQSFAIKFLSIKRHHKVLCGEDFLKDITIPLDREKFLAEQALRNIRLRLVHVYARQGASSSYLRYLVSIRNSIFIDISEVLRCEEIKLPDDYKDRIQIIEDKFDIDGRVLRILYSLRSNVKRLPTKALQQMHSQLFFILDSVLVYVEKQWNGE